MILGCALAVKQAPMFDGLSFDACAFEQDRVASAEVDVRRSQVIEALVVALVVVAIDEALDLGFEVAGQIVVLEQDPVLQRLVPVLDLALGLRMIGRTPDVDDLPVVEPFGEVSGDVAGTITRQQPGFVPNMGLAWRIFCTSGIERLLHRPDNMPAAGPSRSSFGNMTMRSLHMLRRTGTRGSFRKVDLDRHFRRENSAHPEVRPTVGRSPHQIMPQLTSGFSQRPHGPVRMIGFSSTISAMQGSPGSAIGSCRSLPGPPAKSPTP